MLVNENIVKEWYKSTSWVYKNFAYLFENPLWDKNVPRGFSVCPYFWLSLFSLVLFRPFVFIVTKILRPLGKTFIAKPFKFLDNICAKIISKITGEDLPDKTGLGILMTAILAFMIGLVGLVIREVYIWYITSISENTTFTVIFWSVLSGLVTAISSTIYKQSHKHETNPCRTEIYLILWGLGVVASLFLFVPSEFVGFLSNVGGGIWFAICKLFEYLGWVGHWIRVGIWWLITWRPDGYMFPWWCYTILFFVSMAAFGWLFIWLTSLIPYGEPKEITDSEKIKQIRESNRWAWVSIFATILNKSEWVERIENKGVGSDEEKTYKHLSFMIIRKSIETLWKSNLDALSQYKPYLSMIQSKRLSTTRGIYTRFDMLRSYFFEENDNNKEILKNLPKYQEHLFDAAVNNVITNDKEVKESIVFWMEFYSGQRQKKEIKRKNREFSLINKWCLTTTTAVWNGVKAFFSIFPKLWNIVKTVFKNIWIFLVYLWTLIKAKKQNACPYFTFEK
jgi:hypothetical protein